MSDGRYRRARGALWRRSLDAVIVLPVAGEPCTLGGTGPEVWELLAQPHSIAELAAILADAHVADPAVVARDVAPVLDKLRARGAVELVPPT